MKRLSVFIFVFAMAAFGVSAATKQFFELPALPDRSEYGNILIDRQTGKRSMPPVSFSHWSHRRYYTCRVCHFELDFAMEANATEITEHGNLQGEFCGACHNGELAFGHTKEYCAYCHNYGMDGSKKRFEEVKNLPWARYGNEIDWVRALELGLIEPKQSILEKDFKPMEFTSKLELEADWGLIPGAEFPHDKHQQWLDCANCHPDIFNVKKKTTKHFDMQYNLEGKFCGACHLKVAFPMDDCRRCHPKMNG